jgi:hypothetical protein
MASPEQIADLRRMISEPDDADPWTDIVLGGLIDAAAGDLNTVAADVWQEKASTYSEMVDISEAGSSRKNSQLMGNALKMAEFFSGKAESAAPVPGVDLPTTSPIVRPTSVGQVL